MMSHILPGQLPRQVAVVVVGWCLLALPAIPLIADEDDTPSSAEEELEDDTEPEGISRWGPIGLSGKGGSFEVDLIARLFTRGFYAELDYGESDVDLPAVFGGGNVDVSYWTFGIRGYPWVEHAVGGFDFALFAGASLGMYDLDSPLGPLTGTHAGYDLRVGLEVRRTSLPEFGFEVEWVSHEIDVAGEDLDFDGFLFGFRYHWGTGEPVSK